jgi:hypothetical protein
MAGTRYFGFESTLRGIFQVSSTSEFNRFPATEFVAKGQLGGRKLAANAHCSSG